MRKTLRKKLITLIEPKPTLELTREDDCAAFIEDVEKVWELSGTTEELNLIVLNADKKKRVYKSELVKVFPEGVKLLPDKPQSREIYSAVNNGVRRVRYVGKAERFGFNFMVFNLKN